MDEWSIGMESGLTPAHVCTKQNAELAGGAMACQGSRGTHDVGVSLHVRSARISCVVAAGRCCIGTVHGRLMNMHITRCAHEAMVETNRFILHGRKRKY